eukprot:4074648-Alexandrium_andersonii.AAC.1
MGCRPCRRGRHWRRGRQSRPRDPCQSPESGQSGSGPWVRQPWAGGSSSCSSCACSWAEGRRPGK